MKNKESQLREEEDRLKQEIAIMDKEITDIERDIKKRKESLAVTERMRHNLKKVKQI